MTGLAFVRTYLDDLLIITSGSFHDHLQHVRIVLKRLSEAGLRINADKSFARPATGRQQRRFIGMINYYRDMWIRRSDLLAPLTAITSTKSRWEWTDIHQTAITKIKDVLSQELILSYKHFVSRSRNGKILDHFRNFA